MKNTQTLVSRIMDSIHERLIVDFTPAVHRELWENKYELKSGSRRSPRRKSS